MCPEQESTEGTESTFCLAHSAADGPCSRCSDHTDGRVDVRRRATLGWESYGNCESTPFTHSSASLTPSPRHYSFSLALPLSTPPSQCRRPCTNLALACRTDLHANTPHRSLDVARFACVHVSHHTWSARVCACAVLQGGTSSVYPVTHKESGRKYALKVIGMERLSKAKREQLLVEVDIM